MRHNMDNLNYKYLCIVMLGLLFSTGCTNDMSELEQRINSIKSTTPADIDPIPEVKIYEKYAYQSALLRSPFVPDEGSSDEAGRSVSGNGLKPNPNRNKEFLEEFPLDTLTMVGTLSSKGSNYALILDNDSLIHQVKAGNYLGQNDGEILTVTEAAVEVREIVPDGLGGYVYRTNQLALPDES